MSEDWRVGRHFPIHIYEGEDVPVATALTVAYAKQIVADHNAIVTAAPSQPDALKLVESALQQLLEEKCEYMRINNLGDPEKQHTVRVARKTLAAIRTLKGE